MTEQSTQIISWRLQLPDVIETMKAISTKKSPDEMVDHYQKRLRRILPVDAVFSISRRGHELPYYRLARISTVEMKGMEPENTFIQKVMKGGLVGEFLEHAYPQIIDELKLDPSDPMYPYLKDYGSVMVIPVYEGEEILNTVLMAEREAHGFSHDELAEAVWITNLFARSVHNLGVSVELQKAMDEEARENQVIAELQQNLLPQDLPKVPGLELASYYEPAAEAGGDYFDVIPLSYDRWGLLVADVSGHGASAAVLMAITHALLNTHTQLAAHPAAMLEYMNEQLARRYTQGTKFVTAFYGVYNAEDQKLTYASAGHNPPRLKRCSTGELFTLNRVGGLPLGIMEGERYEQATMPLTQADQVVFYTDGITESRKGNEMFGEERLDQILQVCGVSADAMVKQVVEAVKAFEDGSPQIDDQTLLVARVN